MTAVSSIVSLDQFTQSALEHFMQAKAGAHVDLVERDGRICIFTRDDLKFGRQPISHTISNGDIEAARAIIGERE